MNTGSGGGLNGEPTIRRHDGEHRYELLVGDDLAAYVSLHGTGTTVELPHTYTTPAFRGRGFAAQVVHFALEDLSARGQTVVPSCWFVAEYIEAHPEFQHLLGE